MIKQKRFDYNVSLKDSVLICDQIITNRTPNVKLILRVRDGKILERSRKCCTGGKIFQVVGKEDEKIFIPFTCNLIFVCYHCLRKWLKKVKKEILEYFSDSKRIIFLTLTIKKTDDEVADLIKIKTSFRRLRKIKIKKGSWRYEEIKDLSYLHFEQWCRNTEEKISKSKGKKRKRLEKQYKKQKKEHKRYLSLFFKKNIDLSEWINKGIGVFEIKKQANYKFFVHLHLVLDVNSYIPFFVMTAIWESLTGNRVLWITKVRKRKKLAKYVSDYLGKVEKGRNYSLNEGIYLQTIFQNIQLKWRVGRDRKLEKSENYIDKGENYIDKGKVKVLYKEREKDNYILEKKEYKYKYDKDKKKWITETEYEYYIALNCKVYRLPDMTRELKFEGDLWWWIELLEVLSEFGKEYMDLEEIIVGNLAKSILKNVKELDKLLNKLKEKEKDRLLISFIKSELKEIFL